MSFTATIKNELSKLDMTKSENIAELSAFIRNNAKYVEDLNNGEKLYYIETSGKQAGFIASALLYGMLALFLVLMLSTIYILANNKMSMDKLKEEALNIVESE